jgi:hypothetical protein
VAYANDFATTFKKLTFIQPQIDDNNKFCDWACMIFNINKCIIIGCCNHHKLAPFVFKGFVQGHCINFHNEHTKMDHIDIQAYNWYCHSFGKIQTHTTMTKTNKQCKLLKAILVNMKYSHCSKLLEIKHSNILFIILHSPPLTPKIPSIFLTNFCSF